MERFRQTPDPQLLRSVLDYDPSTGLFLWKVRSASLFPYEQSVARWRCAIWNKKNAGKPALCTPHGHHRTHLSGAIFGQSWLAHRIAWAIHHGISEFGLIDHRDGDGLNNRISNLRLATRSQNAQNARQRSDNKSGTSGVNWIERRGHAGAWVARIQVGNRRLFLGHFCSFEEASAARLEALKKYDFGPVHGEISRELP